MEDKYRLPAIIQLEKEMEAQLAKRAASARINTFILAISLCENIKDAERLWNIYKQEWECYVSKYNDYPTLKDTWQRMETLKELNFSQLNFDFYKTLRESYEV